MAADPYRYFRIEARELVEQLGEAALAIERGAGADAVARMLRHAHTLKGAARVVRQPAIADLAHRIEDILTAHQGPDAGAAVLPLIDDIAARVRALDPAPETAAAPAPAEEPVETVRVEISEMDALLRGVTETSAQLAAVRRELAAVTRLAELAVTLGEQLAPRRAELGAGAVTALRRARPIADELSAGLDRASRGLAGGLERVDAEVAQLHDASHRLRLVPARSLFAPLTRVARDASQALRRPVELVTSGGDVRLDAGVLAALRDALAHVVRNAVAHGVEDAPVRAAAGKPEVAVIELTVTRRDHHVAFACRDDGRGIDVGQVHAAAVVRGRATASRPFGHDDAVRVLLAGGVSTQSTVTEIAGRGVGLDVVREIAARLRGGVEMRSSPGTGTTVEIRVPASIVSMPALLIVAGGAVAAVPLEAVRRVIRCRDQDLARSGDREALLVDGEAVPCRQLARLLGRPIAAASGATWTAVLLRAAGRDAALAVDRILGIATVVVRPLAPMVGADPVVAGASLDADGHPQLVLDAAALIAATLRDRDAPRAAAPAVRAPILVVDDSLTTRMLEQSILESAGYQVDLAVSAEDALERSRDRRYGLFIVDVEMPGMNGFEFVAATRADPVLREIPAILVTSRDAVEDRRRGEEAGARAYIVKSEFDQIALLHTIRTLMETP